MLAITAQLFSLCLAYFHWDSVKRDIFLRNNLVSASRCLSVWDGLGLLISCTITGWLQITTDPFLPLWTLSQMGTICLGSVISTYRQLWTGCCCHLPLITTFELLAEDSCRTISHADLCRTCRKCNNRMIHPLRNHPLSSFSN